MSQSTKINVFVIKSVARGLFFFLNFDFRIVLGLQEGCEDGRVSIYSTPSFSHQHVTLVWYSCHDQQANTEASILAKAQLYSYFLSFYLMSFSVPGSHSGYHIQSSCLCSLLQTVTFPQIFLSWITLTEYWSGISQNVLQSGFA